MAAAAVVWGGGCRRDGVSLARACGVQTVGHLVMLVKDSNESVESIVSVGSRL